MYFEIANISWVCQTTGMFYERFSMQQKYRYVHNHKFQKYRMYYVMMQREASMDAKYAKKRHFSKLYPLSSIQSVE